MPGENIQDWSVTAANNSTADSSINWAEGQSRASVNDSARSMMAAHAKNRNLQNGSITTSGTTDAQTFFSGLNYTSVPTGLRVLLKIGPTLTNTTPTTLNMDGIGAVAIKSIRSTDIAAGTLVEYGLAEFIYNGVNWIYLGSELDSPVFTGNPTAPTAPFNDNDLSVANTAFVHAATQYIPGFTDGTTAPAGYLGEFVSASGPSFSFAAGAWGSIAGITLTPGDYDIFGAVNVTGLTAGGVFYLSLGPVAASNNPVPGYIETYETFPDLWSNIGPCRFNVIGGFGIYLNGYNGTVAAATITGSYIRGRRVK